MIICPRTGREWPDEYSGSHLRHCIRCEGVIDTRHEGWRGDPDDRNPFHPNECPPQAAVVKGASNPTVSKPMKMTGKQILESMKDYRDDVHERWLNDPNRKEQGEGESV